MFRRERAKSNASLKLTLAWRTLTRFWREVALGALCLFLFVLLPFLLLRGTGGKRVTKLDAGSYCEQHHLDHQWRAEISTIPGQRVVAVGDLHGDLEHTLEILRSLDIVGQWDTSTNASWAGGTTVFINTGDVADRGPAMRAIYELLRSLQQQSAAHGGRVVLLLGNHEVMNFEGDDRYVVEEDVAAFGGEHPRAEELGPDGSLGAFLRCQRAAVKINDDVFVHGGIMPEFSEAGLKKLNQKVHNAIIREDFDAPVLGDRGPLWNRLFAARTKRTARRLKVCATLKNSLKNVGAARMIIGHTIQDDGLIKGRCGGRVLLIDTGISSAFEDHRSSALEIIGGVASAVYPPDRTRHLIAQTPSVVGADDAAEEELDFRTKDESLEFDVESEAENEAEDDYSDMDAYEDDVEEEEGDTFFMEKTQGDDLKARDLVERLRRKNAWKQKHLGPEQNQNVR